MTADEPDDLAFETESDWFLADQPLRVCPECGLGHRPTTFLGVLCHRCQYDWDLGEDHE